jgi:hypothetical protein
MLKFMGRENMEDYNTNFLTLLETWEAAAKWCSVEHNSEQPTVIARLLGWTRSRTDSERDMLNEVAKACNSAHSLIKDGHLDRSDLTEMSVGAAREIVERAHARVAEIDKWAKENKITKSVAKKQKAHVSGAAKSVAKQVRGGTVSQRDIRQKVDLEAFSRQIKQDKAVPKFPNFGNALADQIQRMLSGDSADEKLTELAAVVHQATDPNDKRVIGRIVFELVHLEDRARVHKNRLENKGKVTPLRILPTGGGE